MKPELSEEPQGQRVISVSEFSTISFSLGEISSPSHCSLFEDVDSGVEAADLWSDLIEDLGVLDERETIGGDKEAASSQVRFFFKHLCPIFSGIFSNPCGDSSCRGCILLQMGRIGSKGNERGGADGFSASSYEDLDTIGVWIRLEAFSVVAGELSVGLIRSARPLARTGGVVGRSTVSEHDSGGGRKDVG